MNGVLRVSGMFVHFSATLGEQILFSDGWRSADVHNAMGVI